MARLVASVLFKISRDRWFTVEHVPQRVPPKPHKKGPSKDIKLISSFWDTKNGKDLQEIFVQRRRRAGLKIRETNTFLHRILTVLTKSPGRKRDERLGHFRKTGAPRVSLSEDVIAENGFLPCGHIARGKGDVKCSIHREGCGCCRMPH